ncbi:hypothetical protein ACERII_20605 [Evansella sp. AB-rgal1]|uniref:hypothetical protein n=1 Tax=Evansella sp. AB-rgal1 TaxID=3242696 RepID=UPI00359E2099
MRTWRVGSISMGFTLLLLGVFLLVSQFKGGEISLILMMWWPIIFILLGIEIIIFLLIKGKEDSIVKYDVFSIIFIGFLGTVGVGLVIATTLGLAEEVSAGISITEETVNLPSYDEIIPSEVNRIVIDGKVDFLTIETTNNREFAFFGTYRTQISENSELLEDDILSVKKVGDTFYVHVKQLPEKYGWNYRSSQVSATIIMPNSIDLELETDSADITLKPRSLKADWNIKGSQHATLYIQEDSDLKLQGIDVSNFISGHNEWVIEEKVNEEQREEWEYWNGAKQNGILEFGDGTNTITFIGAYEVRIFDPKLR